jgi:DNA-directed RNA polymerase alpha subunit
MENLKSAWECFRCGRINAPWNPCCFCKKNQDCDNEKIDILNIDIRDTYLQPRTIRYIKEVFNVNKISDLISLSSKYMLSQPNFGKKSLNEINEMLSKYGLNLKE